MRLYTKTGDAGETGLIGGSRVPKDALRVTAYGEVDELNAAIGLARASCDDAAWSQRLGTIQRSLFVVGSCLADPRTDPPTAQVSGDDVETLEHWIDEACSEVEPLSNFILPGGSELAARFHLTRAIARRAERIVVTLARRESVSPRIVPYLNRLADLLFAWARLANARAGVRDVIWTASAEDAPPC